MTSLDNASYTYRGFRLQALYILYKIFTSPEKYVFQPEGAEDLAVYDSQHNLIEAIQVKSGDSNLVLSNFKNSFFGRSIERQISNPGVKLSIVKFGPIGNELQSACNSNGDERRQVITKLFEDKSITSTKEELERLFESIHAESVVETKIVDEIINKLKDSLAGIDSNKALDLLNLWIYKASESQQKINQSMLHEKIINIGNFLTARKAYHDQWFTIIQPLIDEISDGIDTVVLEDGYYQGEAASFSHIQANFDVIRPKKLEEIHRLFLENNVLFIHGVSGQGKSTLAFRYLKEYYPDTWRFQVKAVENRHDALKSALALLEHTKALDEPVIVYMDISASDMGWEELIKALAKNKNIKLLITLREEDWKQSKVHGVEFSFNELELQFDHEEARQIFDILFKRGLVKRHLDFTEAWEEFGGNGPLLEFVYLVTQGGLLQERLQAQLSQLISETLSGDKTINLLRAVAIGTSYGARLSVKEVVKQFKINPEKTLKRLESEYMLRLDDSAQWIRAIHPIRSEILKLLLIDEGYAPWIGEVQVALPLLHPRDIGLFLLYAFLMHFEQRYELLKILDGFKPNSWESAEGVIRALIWLSVREFIEQRVDYIREIHDTPEGNFVLTIGANIAQAGEDPWESILEFPIMSEDQRQKCKEIVERLEIAHFKFDILKKWLMNFSPIQETPSSNVTWSAFATYCFWLWKCGLNENITIELDWSKIEYDASLSLQTIGRVTTALYHAYPDYFILWTGLYRIKSVERLQNEEYVCELEIQDEFVKAHFISLDLRSEETQKSDASQNIIHEKTMRIIDYLKQLFPEKSRYETQGYGHLLFDFLEHDDTTKHIPKENLPFQNLVATNAMFRRIINNFFRPDTWQVYVDGIIKIREEIMIQFEETISMTDQYFKNKNSVDPLRNSGKIKEWIVLGERLKEKHLLVRNVVDPWGFSDEYTQTEISQQQEQKIFLLASIRYVEVHKKFGNYLTNLGTFFTQAATVFDINGVIGKLSSYEQSELKNKLKAVGIRIEDIKMSWLNFLDAKDNLFFLQKEFHALFGHIIDAQQLKRLECAEVKAINALGKNWYFFINNSNIKSKNPHREFYNRFEERKKQLLSQLLQRSDNNETGVKCSVILEASDLNLEPYLWIKVEHDSALITWQGCFEILLIVSEFVRQQTDFSKTVFQWYWSHICFVPVCKGYCINGMYISVRTMSMIHLDSNQEFNPLRHIPKKISADELRQLGVFPFESIETDMIQMFNDSVSKLMLYLQHLKEFKKCPDPSTETGKEMLQKYVLDLNMLINKVFNEALKMLTDIQETLSRHEESNPDEYISIMSSLGDIWKALYPEYLVENQASVTLDQIETWGVNLQNSISVILSEILPVTMNMLIKK
ncbi:hypothetical protein [Sulfuricurvum sp.]|uniref:hypothetical protein n=1 Tax=Sulfuricurvum sp. TaxID=2025608 RepID=UPI002607CA52|nr:hypothetical protein [Sulfuricurvum sp.]MDD3596825.1 hypothetical protein [Sulfuricurvum sp.]